jgi:hypothetical protein
MQKGGKPEGCCDTGRKVKLRDGGWIYQRITTLVSWNKGKRLCFGRQRLVIPVVVIVQLPSILFLIVFGSAVLIKLI